MANIILFSDITPRNIGLAGCEYYMHYRTKTAGVYAIASNLRLKGFDVLVVDNCASYTFKGIKHIIESNSDGLLWVGVSTSFFIASYPASESYRETWASSDQLFFDDWFKMMVDSKHVLRKNDFVKARREIVWGSNELNLLADYCSNFNVPVIVGGAWVTNLRNGNLANLNQNVYIVPGRAEIATVSITNALLEDRSAKIETVFDNSAFDDVTFRTCSYQWLDKDDILPGDWLPLQVSRGCSFNCPYCDFDRRNSRGDFKDPVTLREELIRNYETYGVTQYLLVDDLYNETKEKVRVLYDQVWSKLPFKAEWTSHMRLDLIYADKESAVLLKESGARMGSFGIETLHDETGKRIGKGLGKEKTIETLEHLKSVWGDDAIIHGYFIAGLPSEPEESILESINWTKNTKLLDCVSWQALWVTPPTHKEFVVSLSPMSEDYKKYDIIWIDNAKWQNKSITSSRAIELANQGNKARGFFIGGYADYPEYRQMGWSHSDIVYLKDKPEEATAKLVKDSAAINARIMSSIKKNLNINAPIV